jgi:hypothetical protein
LTDELAKEVSTLEQTVKGPVEQGREVHFHFQKLNCHAMTLTSKSLPVQLLNPQSHGAWHCMLLRYLRFPAPKQNKSYDLYIRIRNPLALHLKYH